VAWVEEPASPLDYQRLARIAKVSPVPVATGENLFSWDDARNLLRYGGLRPDRDLIQIDISLSYGIGEYRRILDLFESAGWNRRSMLPHAGHLFAAHAVAGLGLGMHESASDLSLAFGGLWDGTEITDGCAKASEAPGVGFEVKSRLMEWLRPLGESQLPINDTDLNAGSAGSRSKP
jgi:L-alanine-DL-glutamate epimerase-like enolase superfamily enzyme